VDESKGLCNSHDCADLNSKDHLYPTLFICSVRQIIVMSLIPFIVLGQLV